MYYSNPKLKFRKFTKPKIFINVYSIPEKFNRFHRPDNSTKIRYPLIFIKDLEYLLMSIKNLKYLLNPKN